MQTCDINYEHLEKGSTSSVDEPGCLKLSVPKNVATKEPGALHFITHRPR